MVAGGPSLRSLVFTRPISMHEALCRSSCNPCTLRVGRRAARVTPRTLGLMRWAGWPENKLRHPHDKAVPPDDADRKNRPDQDRQDNKSKDFPAPSCARRLFRCHRAGTANHVTGFPTRSVLRARSAPVETRPREPSPVFPPIIGHVGRDGKSGRMCCLKDFRSRPRAGRAAAAIDRLVRRLRTIRRRVTGR